MRIWLIFSAKVVGELLRIREHPKKELYVEHLSWWEAVSHQDHGFQSTDVMSQSSVDRSTSLDLF